MDAALEALMTVRGDLGIYNLHGTGQRARARHSGHKKEEQSGRLPGSSGPSESCTCKCGQLCGHKERGKRQGGPAFEPGGLHIQEHS